MGFVQEKLWRLFQFCSCYVLFHICWKCTIFFPLSENKTEERTERKDSCHNHALDAMSQSWQIVIVRMGI